MKGDFQIYISGDDIVFRNIKNAYVSDGSPAFNYAFMSRVFEKEMEVFQVPRIPVADETSYAIGRHLVGCRIGFDAGGSDRKVLAVIDGIVVYSEKVVWHPKVTADPNYHYNEIVSAFRTVAYHIPRVDAIGVSSACVYAANRTMLA